MVLFLRIQCHSDLQHIIYVNFLSPSLSLLSSFSFSLSFFQLSFLSWVWNFMIRFFLLLAFFCSLHWLYMGPVNLPRLEFSCIVSFMSFLISSSPFVLCSFSIDLLFSSELNLLNCSSYFPVCLSIAHLFVSSSPPLPSSAF